LQYNAIAARRCEHGWASMAVPTDDGVALRDIWLLRLQALLARAHGGAAAYAHYGTATAAWGERLALKRISRGPRRCHNRGKSGGLPSLSRNRRDMRVSYLGLGRIANATD
jgi:hypothetical protein